MPEHAKKSQLTTEHMLETQCLCSSNPTNITTQRVAFSIVSKFFRTKELHKIGLLYTYYTLKSSRPHGKWHRRFGALYDYKSVC